MIMQKILSFHLEQKCKINFIYKQQEKVKLSSFICMSPQIKAHVFPTQKTEKSCSATFNATPYQFALVP